MSIVTMRFEEKCEKCNGTGRVKKGRGKMYINCPACGGKGIKKVVKELKV